MLEKPKYLGHYYAAAFQEPGVAAAYHHRGAYPHATFAILNELIVDEPRIVLDVGCGTGDVTRHLVDLVERVDAVDFSQAMIDIGKTLPGGDRSNIRWIHSRAEDAFLEPPYALITGGQSLHWMDWNVVLPRFARSLTPNGYLAIINTEVSPRPWDSAIGALIKRYSTNQDYVPFDMLPAWDQHGLWKQVGNQRTTPEPFEQSVDSYIESFHAMSSLARERMSPERSAAFDAEVRDLVTPCACGGKLVSEVSGIVEWGKPHVVT